MLCETQPDFRVQISHYVTLQRKHWCEENLAGKTTQRIFWGESWAIILFHDYILTYFNRKEQLNAYSIRVFISTKREIVLLRNKIVSISLRSMCLTKSFIFSSNSFFNTSNLGFCTFLEISGLNTCSKTNIIRHIIQQMK